LLEHKTNALDQAHRWQAGSYAGQMEAGTEAIQVGSPVRARFVRRGAQTLPVFSPEH